MNSRFHRRIGKTSSSGFTLVEMMVSMAVLALLMAMIGQLLNSALSVSTQSNKHMDGDAQARAVFDRMAIDFAQIVKRPDVDYFLKDGVNTSTTSTQAGNDQLACYSQVPGYNASTTSSTQQSPVSLVAYRVNSDRNNPYYNQLERLGYGLAWNGSAAPTDLPVVFSPASTSVLSNTISANWPNATGMGEDLAYEEPIGPEVFRMEYYYILRGQTISVTGASAASILPSQLSSTPWYTGTAPPFTDHASVNGLQDVMAITVVIAVIDPKSRALVTNDQLIALAATMPDFSNGMKPGDLEDKWQLAINSATGIPKIAASSIRVYRRDFYLPQINPNP